MKVDDRFVFSMGVLIAVLLMFFVFFFYLANGCEPRINITTFALPSSPQVLCGLPMYVKFAGSVVVALRRWMDAPEINPEDEAAKKNYFDNIFKHHKPISEFMGEDLSRLKITDKDIAGERLSYKAID